MFSSSLWVTVNRIVQTLLFSRNIVWISAWIKRKTDFQTVPAGVEGGGGWGGSCLTERRLGWTQQLRLPPEHLDLECHLLGAFSLQWALHLPQGSSLFIHFVPRSGTPFLIILTTNYIFLDISFDTYSWSFGTLTSAFSHSLPKRNQQFCCVG